MTFDRRPDGNHRRAKLTPQQACQIFWDDHNGMSEDEIAAKHGVNPQAVHEVLTCRKWFFETTETRRELLRLQKARQEQ